MRVLLTGSSGFLGKNLLPVLRKDSRITEVLTIRSRSTDLRNQRQCDDLFLTTRPDAVIHAAGNVGGIGANQNNPAGFMYDNLIMGTNVIDAALRSGINEKFVMLGTVCAYPKHANIPFKEDEIWDGYPEETNAPYGIAKKALMQLVMSYEKQHGFKGVNLVPVNMYGPHDHFNMISSHVIPALVVKIHRAMDQDHKTITLWGTGKASREFLYAPDCARAIQSALFTDVSAEPINLGTGQEITIAALVEMIADIMGYDGKIEYNTSMPDGQPRRCLDVTRAEERLDFKATTSLRDGLVKTVAWWRENR